MKEPFLNPYNFVPAFPRDRLPDELRDAPPPGHDRLPPAPDRWTGRIGVTLTVETPLLLPDTTRATPLNEATPGHLVHPVRTRAGRPYLAPTSVKGMLRSAFEMITNSRMGVFTGHDDRLGFRQPAESALKLAPVVLTKDRKVVPLEAAKLPSYPPADEPVTYPDGSRPRHRDPVVAIVSNDRVLRLARRHEAAALKGPTGDHEKLVTGFLYVTGRNIKGKQNERLFYKTDDSEEQLELDEATWRKLTEQWEALIRNYRAAHDEADILHRQRPGGGEAHASEWLGDEPGRTAWSPHLHEHHYGTKQEQYLSFPRMCWARYEGGRITALYPVMVSRDVYDVAPSDLLDASLHPAEAFDQLSPADRVFGWVAPGASGRRPAAYRGRVRIGPVTCDQEAEQAVRAFPGDGLPLAILGQPKPQQGGFYLSENRAQPDRPVSAPATPPTLYKKTQGLRGRKTYPHHAGLPDGYWDEPGGGEDPTQVLLDGGRYREFRRPRARAATDSRNGSGATAGEEQRDTQNRSIRGWVEPGTTFRLTVEVRDLDTVELGTLAWLLTLPAGHFHRLGLGKPLGFGSVRLDVDPDATELASGEQWAAHYRTLTSPLATTDAAQTLTTAREAFTALVESSRELRTVRASFLTAAAGNPDVPIRYPRVRPADQPPGVPTPPDPDGNNYAWFTENQRGGKHGVRPGRGQSLPRLAADARPLESYVEEIEDREKKDRTGRAPKGQQTNRRKKQQRGGQARQDGPKRSGNHPRPPRR
ncbi:TIGR03986 family type III CRISPR-associated RAMP protein [Streptomyces sp. 4N509B]|uniref:TIGR03986 family type III CRISPR-associated RAMP protein n=1 Tax=Streptomyces sp. 4N509B TaxID=3457413 RepID=UPI003FD207D8